MKAARILAWSLAAILAGLVAVQLWFVGHILWWQTHAPHETAFMARRLDEMREKDPEAALRYRWVGYGAISQQLKRAVVAAEDMKFVDHEGFDWDGIQKALERNQKLGKPVAGGSTISQQLAKNLFLSGERSYWRKGQEAIITLMLERLLDKRRILELYLNVAEWGEGVFGCEAAARHYFNVPAAQLSAEQSARLAAMLPRPRFYDRNRASPYLTRYAARIAARMPAAQVP